MASVGASSIVDWLLLLLSYIMMTTNECYICGKAVVDDIGYLDGTAIMVHNECMDPGGSLRNEHEQSQWPATDICTMTGAHHPICELCYEPNCARGEHILEHRRKS